MTLLLALLIAVPAVVLSDEHQSQTTVGVGDPLPELSATTGRGKSSPIASMLGDRATVVAVHPGKGRWMTEALLADLGPEVAKPYAGSGVNVIAVGVGRTGKVTAGVTALKASENTVKAVLGAGRMPRVYVLDAEGKIVWFDLEYSISTRRELRATLESLTSDEEQE